MKNKRIFKSSKLAFCVILLCSTFIFNSLSVYAAEENTNISKEIISHDIAIVFDNSGSMYDDTDRWSQALYAMGVFASMLDYESGDKLGIYPMGEISIGKNGKSISDRLEITEDNIDDISKIYCKHTSETILRPAYNAKEYLKNSQAKEKWLIVLTDGEFYFDKSADEAKSKKDATWLNKKLISLTDSDIKVQYLGFAEASVLKSNTSADFYASNVSSADALTGELVNVCNKIFQRHKIEDVSAGEFNIDVSMNSVIAFVQGNNAKINSLNTSDGKSIERILNTKINAGTEGTGSNYSAPTADVSGQVVTFSACEAGTYKLNYTGSNIQIFYEPNVKINTYLTNENGEKVDTTESIVPGEYKINYSLIDGVNGKDVSNSKLLSPVKLSAVVTNNGNSQNISSGDTVKLEPDSETHINVSGTYLGEYEINNEGDENTGTINVEFPEEKSLYISMSTEQFDNWYKLSDKDNWKPIRIDIRYNGDKLSDEHMKKLKLSLIPGSSEEFSYTYELIEGESAFQVSLGADEYGNFIEPECGQYNLEANAIYVDEFNREISDRDSIHFDIEWYSKFWIWLIWLIILAALIALIIFVLNLPAWPARMVCVIEKPKKAMGHMTISPSGGTMRLVPFKYELSARVKKNSKLKDKFSKNASVKVIDIIPNKKIQSFTIGSNTYTKENKFLDGGGKPFQGVIRNGTQISMTFTSAEPLSAKIKIN